MLSFFRNLLIIFISASTFILCQKNTFDVSHNNKGSKLNARNSIFENVQNKSFKKNMITIVDQIENYENNSRNNLPDYHIPRITHNTRTDFFSVLIDSSSNGYSYLSGVTTPINWSRDDSDAESVVAYRKYQYDGGPTGFLGIAHIPDFEEDDIEVDIETIGGTNGAGQEIRARYPSSAILSNKSSIYYSDGAGVDYGIPTWHWNSFSFGQGIINYSEPLYPLEWCTHYDFSNCASGDNNGYALLQGQVISNDIIEENSEKMIIAMQQNMSNWMYTGPGEYYPTKFTITQSINVTDGYTSWGGSSFELDFSESGTFSEFQDSTTLGRPIFHINDEGNGYFVWSGYRGQITDDSDHSIHYIHTNDFGESWDDQVVSISSEKLFDIFTDAGLLGGSVNDSDGVEISIDQAFIGYNYQVFTDNIGALHIIVTVIPKSRGYNELFYTHEGAGYYHMYNNNPENEDGWTANLIRDMSDSYKTKMHSWIPTWQYLFADLSVDPAGKMWVSTSVAMDVTPYANVDSSVSFFTYSDVDIFLSYSNGSSWVDAGNITNTPSGYDDAGNYFPKFELHPHLAPNSDDGSLHLTFQVPAMPKPHNDVVWENESYELVKNYIYYGKFGYDGLAPSGYIVINEIMQNPGSVSDSNGEWFELYNPGVDTVNLAGWTITDLDGDIIEIDSTCCVTTIPPSSFYVLGSNADMDANGGIQINYEYDRDNFSLSNSADEIILRDIYGYTKDRVEYDSSFPDPNGKSMELLFYQYNNNDGSNWIESEIQLPSGDYGTPGEPNSRIEPDFDISDIFNYQDNLSVNILDWSDLEGDCLVSSNFDGYVINPCDTAYFDIIINNNGSGDLILDDYSFEELNYSLDYIDRWSVSNDFPIVISPGNEFTLNAYFIPWREVDDYSNWFGGMSNTLTIYNNTSDSLKKINLSTEVYINDVKAYGIGFYTSIDSNAVNAFWDHDGINHILTFNDINFDGTIYLKSYGSEELEIDDINLDSDYFNLDADDGTLSSGESITLQLDFNPPNDGEFIDTIFIESNADIFFPAFFEEGNDNPQQKIIIKGTSGYLSKVNTEKYIPDQFILHQNYPNPFNPVTSLRYELPESGMVNVTIHDMMGRMVKALVNSKQTAGYKSIIWNATNNRNEPVSAGLYLYTIQAGEFRQTRKMVLLK